MQNEYEQNATTIKLISKVTCRRNSKKTYMSLYKRKNDDKLCIAISDPAKVGRLDIEFPDSQYTYCYSVQIIFETTETNGQTMEQTHPLIYTTTREQKITIKESKTKGKTKYALFRSIVLVLYILDSAHTCKKEVLRTRLGIIGSKTAEGAQYKRVEEGESVTFKLDTAPKSWVPVTTTDKTPCICLSNEEQEIADDEETQYVDNTTRVEGDSYPNQSFVCPQSQSQAEEDFVKAIRRGLITMTGDRMKQLIKEAGLSMDTDDEDPCSQQDPETAPVQSNWLLSDPTPQHTNVYQVSTPDQTATEVCSQYGPSQPGTDWLSNVVPSEAFSPINPMTNYCGIDWEAAVDYYDLHSAMRVDHQG